MSTIEYGSMSLEDAYRLALKQQQEGKSGEAAQILQQILAADPTHLESANLLGAVYCALERYTDAVEVLRPVADAAPTNPIAQFNLGCAYLGEAQNELALERLDTAHELQPDSPDILINLGNAHLLSGNIDDAESSYRRAIDLDSDEPWPHVQLATLLASQGRHAYATPHFGEAVQLAPGDGELRLRLAINLLESGRLDEARAAAMAAWGLLGACPALEVVLARLLMQVGEFETVVPVCDRLMTTIYPRTLPLAYKQLALKQLGRDAEFDDVAGNKWIEVRQLTGAGNDADVSALNHALAEHISGHPTLFAFDHFEVTHGGSEIKDVLADGAPAITAWKEQITGIIHDYISRLDATSDNPFAAGAPQNWRLDAWANILGPTGYQQAHIHEQAWLSGVYYVQVPDQVGRAPNDHAGCICFGPPEGEFDLPQPLPSHWVTPAAGTAVLFPSYYYHHTAPTACAEPRIAFDVVPV